MAILRNSLLAAVWWVLLSLKETNCEISPLENPSTKALVLAETFQDRNDLQIHNVATYLPVTSSLAFTTAQCPAYPLLYLSSSLPVSKARRARAESVLSPIHLLPSCSLYGCTVQQPDSIFPCYDSGDYCAVRSPSTQKIERKKRRVSRNSPRQCKGPVTMQALIQTSTTHDLQSTRTPSAGPTSFSEDIGQPIVLPASDAAQLDTLSRKTCPRLLPKKKLSDAQSRATLAVLTALTLTPVENLKELLQLFIDKEELLFTDTCRDILLFRLLKLMLPSEH